jgi:hypothetical protein
MENEGGTSGPTILWDEVKDKKVKSIDGENLGKIEKISQNHVMIEEGMFKKKRFWIPKFLVDVYDGKDLWLDIKKEEVTQRYYYDEEPASSEYDLAMVEFNTKYGKNKSKNSDQKIRLKDGTELKTKSKENYKNIRDVE